MRRIAACAAVALSIFAMSACYSPVARPYDPYQWADPGSYPSIKVQEAPEYEEPAVEEVGLGIHAWPWLDRDVSTPRHRTDVLWPLIKHVRQPEGWYFRIFPILYLKRTPKEDYTFVWPFYGKYERGERTLYNIAFPFLWQNETPGGVQRVLFPIAWLKRGPDESHTWVFPLFGHVESPSKEAYHVAWPLIKSEKSKTSDDHAVRITPLAGWSKKGENTRQYVFPLYEHEEKQVTQAEAVVETMHDERNAEAAQPMIIKQLAEGRKTRTSLLMSLIQWETFRDQFEARILPVFWRKKTQTEDRMVVLPLFARAETLENPHPGQTQLRRKRYGAIPLLLSFWGENGGAKWSWLPFPLNFSATDEDGSRRFLFPVYRAKGDDYESSWVWPLYGKIKDAHSESLHILPPLFNKKDSADTHTWRLWPLAFSKRSPEENYTWILPLYGKERNGEATALHILPPLFSIGQSPISRFLWVAPSLYLERDKNGSSKTWVWPFYGHIVQGQREDRHILWPLFKTSDQGDTRAWRLLPSIFVKRSPHEDYTWVWPLYGKSETPTRVSAYYAWPIFSHKKSAVEGMDWEQWRAFSFFYAHRSADRSVTSLWPLFKHTQNGERREWHALLGLIADEKTATSRKTYAFPLFDYQRHTIQTPGGETIERTELAIPLLLSGIKRNGQMRSGNLIGPLAIWDMADAEHQKINVLGPVLSKEVRPGKTIHQFYPFYYRERNPVGDVSWGALFDLISRTTRDGKSTWRVLWFITI